MMAENQHLSAERARHLTIHGMIRNEDGSYSWKFDNYVRAMAAVDLSTEEIHKLWGRIECPTLLVYGKQSWASNPADDGRINYFNNARTALFDNAGHWVHHDRHDAFLEEVRSFLGTVDRNSEGQFGTKLASRLTNISFSALATDVPGEFPVFSSLNSEGGVSVSPSIFSVGFQELSRIIEMCGDQFLLPPVRSQR